MRKFTRNGYRSRVRHGSNRCLFTGTEGVTLESPLKTERPRFENREVGLGFFDLI